MSGDVGPRLNGEVWIDHGHPGEPCSPPEAVRGVVPCRLVIAPVSGDVGLTQAEREALDAATLQSLYTTSAEYDARLHRAVERIVAERVREAEQRGAVQALTLAADEWTTASVPTSFRDWLRARADRMEKEGSS